MEGVNHLRKSQGQDPRRDKNPEGLLREVRFSDPLRILRLQMGMIKKYLKVMCHLILLPQYNPTAP